MRALGWVNTRVDLTLMIYTGIMTVNPWKWEICLVLHVVFFTRKAVNIKQIFT